MSSNRWLIEGTLTTRSSLRIGSGDKTTRPHLYFEEGGKKRMVEVSSFAIDRNNQAYIPGTTMKGRLRSLAETISLPGNDSIFGSHDPQEINAVGGKVTFFDAHIDSDITGVSPEESLNLAYWDNDRQTAVSAAGTINRNTRTAADKRLFHREFVVEGTSFKLCLGGVDMTEAEVIDLLKLLNCFNSQELNVGLGAGASDGWGRFEWKLISLKTLEHDELIDWLTSAMSDGSSSAGWNNLRQITPDRQVQLEKAALISELPERPVAKISIGIQLNFESNFLVNDPSRTKRNSDNKSEDANDNRPNNTPLLTRNGKVLLPASSIRGALRSQAERILRTIGSAHSACYPDSIGPRPACKPIKTIDEVQTLCPACRIFGAPGWRSTVELTDFTPVENGDGLTVEKQEFVAIDRFTGGAAPGLKFNVTSVYKPKLAGHLTVDLIRLDKSGASGWALALLVLVLRDLVEGDIRLGFGSAKGFGEVRALIPQINIPDWQVIPKGIRNDLICKEEELSNLTFPVSLSDDARSNLELWLEQLAAVCKTLQ